MDTLIKITPDKERAKSLLGTIAIRLDSIKLLYDTDSNKFSSKIVEEYYEIILELITAIMSVDGYRTRSELPGSHLVCLDYLRKNYSQITEWEIILLEDLRKKRNSIKYYGKQVNIDYLNDNLSIIKQLVSKLTAISKAKIKEGS